jgi:pimeloyl-ACP methyl ester carboxylesterase
VKEPKFQGASLVNVVTSVTDSYLHWHQSGYNQKVLEYFMLENKVPPIIREFADDIGVMEAFRDGKRSWTELGFPYRYGLLRSNSWANLAEAICNSPDILDVASQIHFPVLLFAGKYDEVIPVEKTDLLARQLGKTCKLIKTDSKNHFQEDRWDSIQYETIRYFNGLIPT